MIFFTKWRTDVFLLVYNFESTYYPSIFIFSLLYIIDAENLLNSFFFFSLSGYYYYHFERDKIKQL